MASTSDSDSGLSGPELARVLRDATEWLHVNVEAINAINVFPVPDGDTGTNMYLTMRAAMDAVPEPVPDTAGEVLDAMARGALLGARGNSGVILSQYLRGIAEAVGNAEAIDGPMLATSLRAAAGAARAAVDSPVAGTVLTVADEVARATATSKCDNWLEVLEMATTAAASAVASTPTLLPVLRDAGVVDSGAQGLFILLDGMHRSLRGEPILQAAIPAGAIDQNWLTGIAAAHAGGQGYGYCIEFLIRYPSVSAGFLRERLHELGDSVLVVGDKQALHVHLHAADREGPLIFCTSLGMLDKIKIENMELQFDALASAVSPTDARPTQALGVVAMCAGAGQADVLRSIGATVVLDTGGQNPSTSDILAKISEANAEFVIVLPNDKNIALAAQQATGMSERTVWVGPTVSFPQVVASVMAFYPDRESEENQHYMRQAVGAVRTIEVTTAVRDATVDGIDVRTGMTIAIVDGVLAVARDSVEDCLREALSHASRPETQLVTVYWGNGLTESRIQWVCTLVSDVCSTADVETVFGGQPHYDYVIAIE